MTKNDPEPKDTEERSLIHLFKRRSFLAGVSGALGLTSPSNADSDDQSTEQKDGPPFADADHEHVGDDLGDRNPVASITATDINNVAYIDVEAGAAAVQSAVDRVAGKGHNKVVVYGKEGEWNQPVYLPSNITFEIRDGVTITSSMQPADANPFEVGHGTVGGALITNKDHENGNRNITIRGGSIDFDGVRDTSIVWAPVWLHNCDTSRFDSVEVKNVAGSYGLLFSNCRGSTMMGCVGRNIGYDGIAVRLDCRQVDVYRCEAYNCGGPGIQAATFGHGAGAPHDVNFIHCRTDGMIAFHGYPEVGGAQNVSVHGCFARRIGIIGEITDFRISDCDVDTVALSALNDTIRNGRIDSVTFGERYEDSSTPTATILWGFEEGRIENISFSNCTAHGLERFVECRLVAESATAQYIDYTNIAFDGEDDSQRTFIQNQTAGALSNLRLHSCKVWNTNTVVEGPVDGIRIRDTELHGVDNLHDGEVTDLETRDNDRW